MTTLMMETITLKDVHDVITFSQQSLLLNHSHLLILTFPTLLPPDPKL